MLSAQHTHTQSYALKRCLTLYFCDVLTSMSLRPKCMTRRAFFTDFQSFLSLMELTLAHSPCRSPEIMQTSTHFLLNLYYSLQKVPMDTEPRKPFPCPISVCARGANLFYL